MLPFKRAKPSLIPGQGTAAVSPRITLLITEPEYLYDEYLRPTERSDADHIRHCAFPLLRACRRAAFRFTSNHDTLFCAPMLSWQRQSPLEATNRRLL